MKEIQLEATLPIFTWRACELFYEDAAFEKRHLQGMNPPRSGALVDFPNHKPPSGALLIYFWPKAIISYLLP